MKSKKCLLIIDLQAAMFSLSSPLHDPASLLRNIKGLVQKARTENIPIIFVQHTGGENSPFQSGSEGWKIHPEVQPKLNDFVLEKKFSDAFQGTGLNEILTDLSINEIIICGLVTEGCVDTTVRRAYSLGYQIQLVSDCHSTTDNKVLTAEQIINHHNEVLKIFADVNKFEDIVLSDSDIYV